MELNNSDGQNQDTGHDTKQPAKKIGRRGFLVGSFAAIAAAVLAKLSSNNKTYNLDQSIATTEAGLEATLTSPEYKPEQDLKLVPKASLKSSALILFNGENRRPGGSGTLVKATTLEDGSVVATFLTARHVTDFSRELDKFTLEIRTHQFPSNPTILIDKALISTKNIAPDQNLPNSKTDIGAISVKMSAEDYKNLQLEPIYLYALDSELKTGEKIVALSFPAMTQFLDIEKEYFVSTGTLGYLEDKGATTYTMNGTVAAGGSSGGGVFLGDHYVGLLFEHFNKPNQMGIARTGIDTILGIIDEAEAKLIKEG